MLPYNHDHEHKLELELVESCFTCVACGKDGDGYPYRCHECDLTFHVSCGKYEAEVNHASHCLHPLKLLIGEPPDYSDGKCRLCGGIVDEFFYHCSACNFTLDLHCVGDPPSLYLHDLKTHDHKLTLVPKYISFSCTICGLHGDRSPYVCLPCDFFIHKDCIGLPRLININRHDHRISRVSLIGVVNAVCRICRNKMDWTCGGYSCKRCPDYIVHTKCAIRKDVWNGTELGQEAEEEDVEPYAVNDNTIHHFLHEEHKLKLHNSGTFMVEWRCGACNYPIYHNSFYSCVSCDYRLHERCAKLPEQKSYIGSNRMYILDKDYNSSYKCEACGVRHNGIGYVCDAHKLDLQCASISDPFSHLSHPHRLFYTSPQGVCSACNQEAHHVLRCVEEGCRYILDFKCALLPSKVKHEVDDHFLSLCYGREAIGKYWCDICETETDPTAWFYICNDCGVTVHIGCVLVDLRLWNREEKWHRRAFST